MSLRPSVLLLLIALATAGCREAEGVAVDPLDREAEEVFTRFLRIDTTNPPGNETRAAEFLRAILAKEGIEARLIGPDPKRQAVYARLRSGTNEKALLLLSHLDVVPAGQQGWTHPPFGGVIDSGYIWGRGAMDMKSLTVAQLFSMIELKRKNAKLRRDLILLATPDEELGGLNGTKVLLEQHPELFTDVGYVINEGGSNETAVDKVMFWAIEVHQKNPLWIRLTADGRGGHSASPPDNGGAAAKLVRALYAVDRIETPYMLDPSVARVLAEVARVRKSGRAAVVGRLREPLDPAMIEREVPESFRSVLRDTIAITHVDAGSVVNIMPSTAVAHLDIRLLPSHRPEPMIEAVKKAAGKDLKVEVLLSSEPVPASPIGGELYDTIARAMRESSPGSLVGPYIVPGTNDSRYFRARGIVAYGIHPFKTNYYDVEGIHGPDERIRVRFFAEGVRLTRRIVRDFCAQ